MNKKFAYGFLLAGMAFFFLVSCNRINGTNQKTETVPPQDPTQITAPSQPFGVITQIPDAIQTQTPLAQPTDPVDSPQSSLTPTDKANSDPTAVLPTDPMQSNSDDPALDMSADQLDQSLQDMINQLDSIDKLDDVK